MLRRLGRCIPGAQCVIRWPSQSAAPSLLLAAPRMASTAPASPLPPTHDLDISFAFAGAPPPLPAPPVALVLLNYACDPAFLKAVWATATFVVAADGAAKRLYHALDDVHRGAYLPHYIVGDCDSIDAQTRCDELGRREGRRGWTATHSLPWRFFGNGRTLLLAGSSYLCRIGCMHLFVC